MASTDPRPFLTACELHDADGIAACLRAGLDPNLLIDGKTPVTWLLEMYTRSDAFPACLRALLNGGAILDVPDAAPVLLDDGSAIQQMAAANPDWLRTRITLPSAFTPLEDVTWLHVAAELGHVAAARTLLALGLDVNTCAGRDTNGMGGHTPIFHTVNSHADRSRPVMELLLAAHADVSAGIAGLVWGRGFEWETTFFDLTPLAYAQLGLLPQMHREPRDVDATVRTLLAASGRPVPSMPNVPNQYVSRRV